MPQDRRRLKRLHAPANHGEYNEVFLVALQPRYYPGPQERRLAGTRCRQNREHTFTNAAAHAPQGVDCLGDVGIAAEEDGGILFFECLKATIDGAVRIVGWRPGEARWIETRAFQADGQPLKSFRLRLRRGNVGNLKIALQFERQVVKRCRRNEQGKDALSQKLCREEFGLTPARTRSNPEKRVRARRRNAHRRASVRLPSDDPARAPVRDRDQGIHLSSHGPSASRVP